MYTPSILVGSRLPGFNDGLVWLLAASYWNYVIIGAWVIGLTPCLNPCDGDEFFDYNSTTFSLGRSNFSNLKRGLSIS